MELSSHPLHDHIVSQVGRFISGISNQNIQRGIVNAIDEEIRRDDFLKLKLRKAIEPTEIYRFLTDVISRQPILTIIIEKATEELREALNTFRYSQIKVIEFQTFTREGVGLPVHAHLFEPLYKTPLQTPSELEIDIRSSNIKYGHLRIPKGSRHFFPGYKTPFDLETDTGVIKTWVSYARGAQVGDPNKGRLIRANLAKWYRKHPAIKVGDKVRLTVIESMKKYNLEVVKQ